MTPQCFPQDHVDSNSTLQEGGNSPSKQQPQKENRSGLAFHDFCNSQHGEDEEEEAFSELMDQDDRISSSGEHQGGPGMFSAEAQSPARAKEGMSLLDTAVAEEAAREIRRECHALAASLQEKGILVDPSGRACSSPSRNHVTPSPAGAFPDDETEQQVCLLFRAA
jgi:hypothetical protein